MPCAVIATVLGPLSVSTRASSARSSGTGSCATSRSAPSSSRASTSRPDGVFRSSASERFPVSNAMCSAPVSMWGRSLGNGAMRRISAPVGGSTLTTLAPKSEKRLVATPAAIVPPTSTTRRPSSGCIRAPASPCAADALPACRRRVTLRAAGPPSQATRPLTQHGVHATPRAAGSDRRSRRGAPAPRSRRRRSPARPAPRGCARRGARWAGPTSADRAPPATGSRRP